MIDHVSSFLRLHYWNFVSKVPGWFFPSSFLEAIWSYLSWCTSLSNIKHSRRNRLIQSMFLIVCYYKENENKNIHWEFLNLGDQIGRKSKCFIPVHQGISYQVVDSLREKISLNLEKNIKEPTILYKHKVIKIKITLISLFSLMLLIIVPLESSFFPISSCNLT